MSKSPKYDSYEAWVCGRIGRCKSKMMTTNALLKIPAYIRDLEIEPTAEDLELRIRILRDGGVLAAMNKRWYLRSRGATK